MSRGGASRKNITMKETKMVTKMLKAQIEFFTKFAQMLTR